MRLVSCLVLAAAVACPSLALAGENELTFSGGVTLTSRYISSGIEQSTGAAIQPWLEGDYNGFYFGAWGSTVSKEIMGDDIYEVDLYLGYRNEIGKFSYDLSYARYYYNEMADGEHVYRDVVLSLGYAATEQFSFGTTLKHNTESGDERVLNSSIFADYAVNDKIGLSAAFGNVNYKDANAADYDYWSVGGSYALNDALSVSLSWNDTNRDGEDDGIAILALDYSF